MSMLYGKDESQINDPVRGYPMKADPAIHKVRAVSPSGEVTWTAPFTHLSEDELRDFRRKGWQIPSVARG